MLPAGGDFLAPNSGRFAALLREANDENHGLLLARIGESDFRVVERFRFDGRDGLRRRKSGREEEQQKES